MKIAPHGNACSGESYVRTMPSVTCKLKEEAKKKTPKRALQFVSQEAGGIMEATSAGAPPRCRQQIKDARRKITSNIMTHCTQSCTCARREKVPVVIRLSEW